ncbi:unnamed protein product [Vicia faba]|uniref:Uncharacterized protein n=1 Tax=Vicia faba TaxID=3906 RepID=A0AAV1B8F4_VICFA|nr:unnamed protein product [Vicia faba]
MLEVILWFRQIVMLRLNRVVYELEQVMSLLCFVTGSACLGYDSYEVLTVGGVSGLRLGFSRLMRFDIWLQLVGYMFVTGFYVEAGLCMNLSRILGCFWFEQDSNVRLQAF